MMIDIHCHLLPGVDDGPANLEESLALCRLAAQGGTTHAIVTPHIHPGRWDNSRQSIKAATGALQEAIDAQGIALRLGFAAEVRLSDEVIVQVRNETIAYYGAVDDFQVMLLEFPHNHIPPGSEKLAAWLLGNGIRPLIAHPERNREAMREPGILRPFLEAGCWLQLTAGSLVGNFGTKARALALKLLEEDAVAVVASDGHNDGAREPGLAEAYRYIESTLGEPRARRLLLEAPATIAADQFRDTLDNKMSAAAV